jgi:hypothetical protein
MRIGKAARLFSWCSQQTVKQESRRSNIHEKIYWLTAPLDRLCGLVVRVFGYRSGGPGSIPGTTKKKVVGLERGALSLENTTEELLDRKVAASVKKTENTAVGIRHADHVAPFIRKSWKPLRREAAVARSV